ncbi:MAG: GIY-YIG nuclease family protein [Synergistaceae bacterium]|nr:GIY-YIG nuclease family protein [Synergistaceae bacterium]
MTETAYVYILKCSDGTLYTGWTNDLEKRLAAHNAGTASKYTHSKRPVEMLWHEPCGSKAEALKREAEIKKLSRSEKLKLIFKK